MKQMNFIWVVCFALFTLNAQQVGINTTDTKATLDIVAEKTDGSQVEGLLIPRISKIAAHTMAIAATKPQESNMVYISNITDNADTQTATSVADITEKGYYFWNGTKWVKTAGENGVEWKDGSITTGSSTTNYIYANQSKNAGKDVTVADEGKVGIGVIPGHHNDSFLRSSNIAKLEIDGSSTENAIRTYHGRNYFGDFVGVGREAFKHYDYAPLDFFVTSYDRAWKWTPDQVAKERKDMILMDFQAIGGHNGNRKISIGTSWRMLQTKFRAHSIDFGLSRPDLHTQPFMAFSVAGNAGAPPNEDARVERMRITGEGNIGVGTATPTEKFEVIGNIKVHGVTKLQPQSITANGTCESGSIGYGSNGNFYGCKGGQWKQLQLAP